VTAGVGVTGVADVAGLDTGVDGVADATGAAALAGEAAGVITGLLIWKRRVARPLVLI
jgi:ABC-type uncharacterized transport system permease subunit